MKKSVMTGTVIVTLVLLGISLVPPLFLGHGDRFVWQLNNWAWIFASILIAVIAVLLTVYYTKGKHILWKIMAWLGCIVLVMACVISFLSALICHDEHLWSNKDYAVYSEYRGFIDPYLFVLYKRDGFIDRRMFSLGSNDFGEVKKAEYSMYNDLDLIKEEVDQTTFESDSVFHCTAFYRLSDGYRYEQEKNDSLLNVLKTMK